MPRPRDPLCQARPIAPLADLQLVSRADSPVGCQFEFMLVNTLPTEIRSLVPEFAVQRSNGVVYSTQTIDFTNIKPGDRRQRAVRFPGMSDDQAAPLNPPYPPARVRSARPVSASQILSVPSSPADSNRVPSGPQATA